MHGTYEPKLRIKLETMLLTPDVLEGWVAPWFQRPLRINSKVQAMAEEMKKPNGNMISGMLTLGTVAGEDDRFYVVDGQHRIAAAKLSGVNEFMATVRIMEFDTMDAMAAEFLGVNSQLVRMRPDDMLRGLEGALPVLRVIREKCPFVSYDNIRRGDSKSAVLSMSATIRSWVISGAETPALGSAGSGVVVAHSMTMHDAEECIAFLKVARAAWGVEAQNYRLWGNLNLALCMWLWRAMVKQENRHPNMRSVVINEAQFKRCMMSVAADGDYNDWLVGRNIGERDRSPAYGRLKTIFAARLRQDGIASPLMPQPAWLNYKRG